MGNNALPWRPVGYRALSIPTSTSWKAAVLLLLGRSSMAVAHEHHMAAIPQGKVVSEEPIDAILWIHILLMTLAFGVIFPTGMVLGIIRSRWHVLTQGVGAIVATIAWFLGHAHKGRQFSSNIHAAYAPWLMFMLITQGVVGIYLKLHLERGIHGKIRRPVVMVHSVLGKVMPVAAWVQMLFGGITALGFCRADHLGQCLAHFIMGSAFIGYGIILTILLLVGQLWLRRTGRSQEFFDSLIIAAWGCVNTFTEHRWGGPWAHNDLQHTAMGVIWWCAGLVGIWLSRKRDGSPKRNVIPGVVILLTGYAMSSHPQTLPLSTMVHTVFGYTLMGAGLTRIIEICFVLGDRNATTEDGSDPHSFQYLPPFLLYASGFLFMGATEEQMALLSAHKVTHVSYILILYSIAFLLFLFVNMLLHLYAVYVWPAKGKDDPEAPTTNGHAVSGRGMMGAAGPAVERRVQDAEEFELAGLMSGEEDGEEDDDEGGARKEANGHAR